MKRERGYLIVELIGAVFVMSMAASIVCSILISSAAKGREFDRAVTARIIARNELARLKYFIREGIPVAEGEKIPVESPMAQRLHDFEGWSKVEGFREGIKQISVVVNWKERGGTKSVRLRSLVAER